jgi:hypothetical protein
MMCIRYRIILDVSRQFGSPLGFRLRGMHGGKPSTL